MPNVTHTNESDTNTTAPSAPVIPFDNTFARELEGFYVAWQPAQVPQPRLVRLNRDLALELGLDVRMLDGPLGAQVFAGNLVPEGATPIAQAYAGHQFGGFSPQLGDGRAILLGELIDRHGSRRDIAFKGSGRTPFSRGGDGKAALGPVLREYLVGEAMHALGIPSTRALAAVATGETVMRDLPLPGAVLTRVAASHLRVGTFQYFAARGQYDAVRRLLDYSIQRHYPELQGAAAAPLAFLQAVAERQVALVAQWMHVGFIHGVMNTDNCTISGETIDYGPCAFLEAYDPRTVFSSIDSGGRYAYGNQPAILRWNLARLAETLLPLIDDDQERAVALATEALATLEARYEAHWLRGARAKLGLQREEPADHALATEWLEVLHGQRMDFTLAWRRLADAAAGDDAPLLALAAQSEALERWLPRWRERLAREPQTIEPAGRARRMRAVSPLIIPRNHRVEEALSAAVHADDLAPFERLLAAVTNPFEERAGFEAYALPAPAAVTARYRTYCGT